MELITNFNIFENNNDLSNILKQYIEKNIIGNDYSYLTFNKINLNQHSDGTITIDNLPTYDVMKIPAYIRAAIQEFCKDYNFRAGMIFKGTMTLKPLNTTNEAVSDTVVTFDDEKKLNYYKKLWNSLNVKYTQYNKFFPQLYKKMVENRKLSRLQWAELEYLLKNGKSRYDAGILPKNYL